MDGTLAFLYVIEPLPSYVISQVPEGVIGDRITHAEEELGKLAAQCGCSDAVVREGAPATEILEHAAEINADLIVLHSHDPGLSDYFLGSTASRVVRHAHCSVHVVRHPDDHK
jgi:nucleotide-binding universal stress UspA family protein